MKMFMPTVGVECECRNYFQERWGRITPVLVTDKEVAWISASGSIQLFDISAYKFRESKPRKHEVEYDMLVNIIGKYYLTKGITSKVAKAIQETGFTIPEEYHD